MKSAARTSLTTCYRSESQTHAERDDRADTASSFLGLISSSPRVPPAARELVSGSLRASPPLADRFHARSNPDPIRTTHCERCLSGRTRWYSQPPPSSWPETNPAAIRGATHASMEMTAVPDRAPRAIRPSHRHRRRVKRRRGARRREHATGEDEIVRRASGESNVPPEFFSSSPSNQIPVRDTGTEA